METLKPWYRLDPYAAALAARIRHSICASEMDRRQSICDALVAQYAYERERWRYHDRGVFTGAPRTGYTEYLKTKVDPALNQIRGITDKMEADLIKATPGLTVQTTNGRWEDRVQDRIRSRLLQGMLDRPDFSDARRRWMHQGLLERVGWILPRYESGGLQATQLQQYQVYYDARGALNKDTPDIHVVQLMDRLDLLRWYSGIRKKVPDKESKMEAIRTVPRDTEPMSGSAAWLGAYRASLISQDTGDRIRVVWSWRKSWRTGEPDGRAVITLMPNDTNRGAVLLDQPFDRVTLPVVWWTPWETAHGIDGISIADSMIVTDLALAHMIHRVNQMMRRHGADKLILPRNVTPDVAAQYESAFFEIVIDPGHDPEDNIPKHFRAYQLNPSDMAYMDFLMSRPSGLLGFTQQAVQGEDTVSPGASGIARIQAKFQALGRQLKPITAFTTANRRLGDEVLYAADDAIAIDPKFRGEYADGGRISTTPWKKYALASQSRRVVIAEVGLLGSEPSGQLQALEQLAGTGLVPAEAAAQFIADQPDVQRLTGMVFAAREAIQRHLWILSDKTASDDWPKAQPTEDMDLALAVRLTTQTINAAIADDAMPETINRLRAYSLAAQSIQSAIAPPQPAETPPLGPV